MPRQGKRPLSAGASGDARRAAPERTLVGNQKLAVGTQLVEMTDSTCDYTAGRFDVLRERLTTDGFLFVRGVIAQPTIAAAREMLLRHLQKKGAIQAGTAYTDGYIEYQSV